MGVRNPSERAAVSQFIVYRLLNPLSFAAGQLAVFQGASQAPLSGHNGRASNAEKQPTGRGSEGALKMGRLLRCLSITYRSRYAPSSRLADDPF
jgi:hypothetical protein